ncbi:MAG: hypothetical protein BWY01_01758 [Synergistetes bacterium ADurb.Bin155]|jgi:hypothetical protein|nr:hypothetical protein [Synergistales bacterium]NMD17880.1 hypothetical protein [Synergistaceae bacterium]OQB44340.1 MAG: hypothetical protein BWY01_01758 [Synergistetes bacterium ADurb.Bin155]MBP8996356.1 hypothetical protein [Synergistales bacterium]HOC82171.1 hypothetical protein [Synergistales bacterium]
MKGKGYVLLALLMLSLLAVSGFIFHRNLGLSEQNRVLRETLQKATEEIQRVKEKGPVKGFTGDIPQPDWEGLKKEGRTDPRGRLVEDLLARDDLIPWEGIHGGTMKIYDPSLVWFAGPRWCVAWAEDGHIGGFMLLRFDEDDDGNLEWRLLDSALAD